MRSRFRAFSALTALAILIAHAACASEPKFELVLPKGVEAATILAPANAPKAAALLKTAFDVDPDGLPVFANGSTLQVFGSPNPLAKIGSRKIIDFAWMRDGSMLMTTKSHLAGFDGKNLELGPQTPTTDMRVRPAGMTTAYVFGGANAPVNHNVYLFSRDGRVAKLATTPTPATAVAGDGETTYIAAGGNLIRLSRGAPAKVVLKTAEPILSLARAPQGLFYATAKSVGYLSADGVAHDFIHGDGAILRIRGSALYLLLGGGSHVVRLRPVGIFARALGARQAPLPKGASGATKGTSDAR